jgi:hypothetical protein
MLKIKTRSFKFIFLQIVICVCAASAKSFTQCELSEELQNVHHLTVDEARNLICIAQKFSRLHTNIIGGDLYGIFQINQKWCGHKKAGGECNIKCNDLLDDDISDDVRCAQKVIAKVGMQHAWRIEKTQGCRKELKNLETNCPSASLHRDFCEYARKLSETHDISKLDALTWSCIAEHHSRRSYASLSTKTGNVNLNLEEEVDEEAACVKRDDVECSIKLQKQRGVGASGFNRWPEYEAFCKDISGDGVEKCFRAAVESESEGTKLKDFELQLHSTEKPRQFTTSTDISVIVETEDDDLEVITPESATEYLTKTLEKPTSEEDDMTVEGYSKVRLMFAEKNLIETSDDLKTTSEKFDDFLNDLLINSSKIGGGDDEDDGTRIEKSHRCEVTRKFIESGQIPEHLIGTFVCIAERESGLNASVVRSRDGMTRYGLFQIDDIDYCNTNEKISECDVLCTHLTDTQFDNDLECAKLIFNKMGLNYWPSHAEQCKDISSRQLVESCHETHTTTHRPYTVVNYELLKQKFNLTARLATTTTSSSSSATTESSRSTINQLGAIDIEGNDFENPNEICAS